MASNVVDTPVLIVGSEQKLDFETFDSAAWVRRAPGRDDAKYLYDAPLMLVRPDGHVAWRAERGTNALAIIDAVRAV